MKAPVKAGIVLLVIAGITGVYLWNVRSGQHGADTVNSPNDALVVSMRQDEYVPSVITVRKGQTVVFKNDSPDWRWPASNLHPTHDIFPEFDPKEPVAAGKSWSFRFDKPGDWDMHDHLAPYITGTVHVK